MLLYRAPLSHLTFGVRKLSFLFFLCVPVCVRILAFLLAQTHAGDRRGSCVGGQLNGDPLSLPSPSLLSPRLPSFLALRPPLWVQKEGEEGRRGAQEEKKTVSQPASSKHTGQNFAIAKITAQENVIKMHVCLWSWSSSLCKDERRRMRGGCKEFLVK